ncbi:hypothetical protein BD769DRAFT_1402548 [Suillus cothurnatus]|nr:hypothetical protein BD769DRAFT_1402548 [Suillus cothurnatus]
MPRRYLTLMACINGVMADIASLDAVPRYVCSTAATGSAPLTCLVIDRNSRPWGTCMASLDSLSLLGHVKCTI